MSEENGKQLQAAPGSQSRQDLTSTGAIREFMLRVVAWPLNGEPGYINLEYQVKNPQREKPIWISKSVKQIDEFLILTKQKSNEKTVTNLYFCLSRQAIADKRGTENATTYKAVWADIDVKEKGYRTIEEAINALFEFIEHYRLPPPSAVVVSGSGLHVYWFSTRPLSYAEWRPYAEGLKAAALQWGLKCDAGVIADGARVLRVPGTRNFKTNPPKPVRLIHLHEDINFAAKLKVLSDLTSAPRTNGLPEGFKIADALKYLPRRQNLAGGIEHNDAPLLPFAPIKAECAWLREAHDTGGKEFDNPQWSLTTLVAVFLEDGNKLAHEFGNQHEDYTHNSTEEKWEEKKRAHEKGVGWPYCKTISDNGGKPHCSKCQHFAAHVAADKSPLHLHGGRWDQERRAKQIAENIKIGDDVTEPLLPQIMTLEEMEKRLVFVGSKGVVADLATGRVRKKEHAADEYAASQHTYILQSGAPKKGPALKFWIASKGRMTVEVLAWVPGAAQICQPPEGQGPAFNMWRGLNPMAFPEDWQERVEPFLEHIDYLVPISSERERFLDWLAHIPRCPEVLPHTAYLMTTPVTGIGRNLLASILVRALRGFVAAGVSLPELLDGGFTGRLSRKLLVIVDEAREGSGERRYQRATRLTQLITEEHRHVNHKYGYQIVEKNCGRWLMFSNHDDAIPFDTSDRRVIVIANPTVRKPDAYYERLYGLLNDKDFIGSVRHWLETKDITAFRPGEHAPMNEAKLRVLDEMMSETERAVAEFKEDCKTELASRDEIKSHVVNLNISSGLPVNDTHLTHAIRRAGMINTGRRITAY